MSPVESKVVEIYLCGHTAYKPPHLGNLRPVVVFDLIIRLLRHLDKEVRYVRNTTDIDDKIIQQAALKNVEISTITEKATAAHRRSEEVLGCIPPTINPHATGYIKSILDLIEGFIASGVAYESEGHVFFDVQAVKKNEFYAGREEQPATDAEDYVGYKKHPGDFVLWKPAKPNEPGWTSPYSLGRPGWHTECVAMIRGTTVNLTIHGGGCDLRFPHHANELLQLACCGSVPQMWVHTGMLVDGNGNKMSKSLGNTVDVVELAEYIPGVILRIALLSSHYRHPLPWTPEKLHQAEKLWIKMLERVQQSKYKNPNYEYTSVPRGIIEALCDDLNTPQMFTELLKLSDEELFYAMDFLGLFDAACIPAQTTHEEIDKHVAEYRSARESGNYAESDRIRAELADEGVCVRADYSWYCGLPKDYQRFFAANIQGAEETEKKES